MGPEEEGEGDFFEKELDRLEKVGFWLKQDTVEATLLLRTNQGDLADTRRREGME